VGQSPAANTDRKCQTPSANFQFLSQPLRELREGTASIRGGFQAAFPNHDDVPALFAPELLVFLVAPDVVAELRVPIAAAVPESACPYVPYYSVCPEGEEGQNQSQYRQASATAARFTHSRT